MRKKRAKWIRKQLYENNPNLLIALRNKLGDKTKGKNLTQFYRNAKKLWYECGKRKDWGIKNL